MKTHTYETLRLYVIKYLSTMIASYLRQGAYMTSIPEDYESQLSLYDTQRAIERIKYIFLAKLCAALRACNGTSYSGSRNRYERQPQWY